MEPLPREPAAERRAEPARDRLGTALDLVGTAVEHSHFRAAATAFATELALRLGLERVSLGFVRRGGMRVEALSHSAHFEARAQLIQELADAMDEAADQDATLVHPALPGRSPSVVRAHEALTRREGIGRVCSVPLTSDGCIVGALTLESREDEGLDAERIALCEDVALLVGPILALKREKDARPLERLREWLAHHGSRLVGPGHATLKAVSAALLLGLGLVTCVKGTYRVTADATLEGRVQRAIVAGLEGYIAEAHARAGDLVQKGQILGRLDERDLRLERRKWLARREQLRSEHREALAVHERTQLSILSAKLAEADAQIALLDEQRSRTRLVAPFDGIVVKGDLSQSLGSPVEKGAVLFQLAPLEGYRIILKVDERDIAAVSRGASGQLSLSALPGQALPLTVERITPVTVAEDGRNYFRVEASLDEPSGSLQPGMEGVGKIEIGPRRLLWIWTHDLVDWLRLWTWTWWA